MLRFFVLLCVVSLVHAFDDRIMFEENFEDGVDDSDKELRLISANFPTQQQECFKEEKFLYEPDKKCYTLLTTGPCSCKSNNVHIPGRREEYTGCQNGHDGWFTLREMPNGQLLGICRPCRCCEQPFHVYMAEDGKCHHQLRDRSLFCHHNGTELRNNEFGEGECGCIRSPPHARLLGSSSEECYPLYHRGPCQSEYVLFPDRDPRTLEPVGRCSRDPCAKYGEGFAQWKSGDGKCYELGTQGPCDRQSKFKVQRTIRIPDCLQSTNTILNPKQFDDNGPPPTDLPKVDKNFALDIITSRGKRKTRKP